MQTKSLVLNPYQKRKSCCFQCEERTVGCHSTCEDYISEHTERKEQLAKIRNERELNLMDAERNINKTSYFRKVGSRK